MTWAKLDDKANENRKQLRAGAEACWLWACGLMYANRQPEHDGVIPDEVLPGLYAPSARNCQKLADRLVEVKLWDRVDGGYRVHNYHRWNPSAEQVERERAEGRRRAAASYSRRKSSPEESPKTSSVLRPKKSDSSGSTPTPTPIPDLTYRTDAEDLTGLPREAPSPGASVRPSVDSSNQLRKEPEPEPVTDIRSVPEPLSEPDPDDRETVCPLNLLERAESIGLVAELSEKLNEPRAVIRDAIQEFVGFWTIGGGTGRRKRNWMRHLREHIRRSKLECRLRAPGAIESDFHRQTDRGATPEQKARWKAIAESLRAQADERRAEGAKVAS